MQFVFLTRTPDNSHALKSGNYDALGEVFKNTDSRALLLEVFSIRSRVGVPAPG